MRRVWTEAEWRAWIGRSPKLARVTPDALEAALEGFRLGVPLPGFEWLARAIQGALVLTIPVLREVNNDDGECCVVGVPNATEAKRLYRKLSGAADALLIELNRNSDLLAYGLLRGGKYAALSAELESAASAFAEAAQTNDRLPARWRQKRVREERVERAALLSPIFELAYDAKPLVNNWSDGGPWPDFYQRIVALIFGERATPDLAGVLREAGKLDRFDRVIFAPGQIPNIS